MTVVPPDYQLAPDQFANPVLWFTETVVSLVNGHDIDVSDEVMDRYLGPGSKLAIKSFGHNATTGTHFLLTRRGTAVHTDKAYLRYSHQLIIRNDGNRIRGLARFDDEARWHPPMVIGTMYCLDTHSPHQGIADPRFPEREGTRGIKAVIAVDRSVPLDPDEAWKLIEPYLWTQLGDFPFDPKAPFEKWKEPK